MTLRLLPSDRALRSGVLVLAALSLACASAGRYGEHIHIADESALIIWDAASKTQHFIRRASFNTKAKDFGFLVPTPTAPKLAEADDAVFRIIANVTTPMSRRSAGMVLKGARSTSQVIVLDRVTVAGLDAAVLSATDSSALGAWLKANGYASTPELMDWAAYYVAKRWVITAFKLAQRQPAARLESSAVRMSFQAEQPYFPYREPAAAKSAHSEPRLLRVYFLASAFVEGKLGANAAWRAETTWSDVLEPWEVEKIVAPLKLPAPLRAGLDRLTVFDDRSVRRQAGDDLIFSSATDQERYRARR